MTVWQRFRRRLVALVPVFAVLAGPQAARANDLKAIADATFALWVARNPGLILKYATDRAMPDDGTPAAAAETVRVTAALSARLAQLAAPGTARDRLLHDQAARVLDDINGRALGYWDSFTIDSYGSQLFDMQDMFDNYPLHTGAERTHYLALAALMARIADGQRAKLAGQAERGIPLPRAVAISGATSWGDVAGAAFEPGAHPFVPDTARLSGVPQAEAAAFMAELRRILADTVAPAARRLVEAVVAATPTARAGVGMADVPGWRKAYVQRVRSEIGPGVTPTMLHRIGLSEVRKTTEEMARVRRAAGLPADEAAAIAVLRARPVVTGTAS